MVLEGEMKNLLISMQIFIYTFNLSLTLSPLNTSRIHKTRCSKYSKISMAIKKNIINLKMHIYKSMIKYIIYN